MNTIIYYLWWIPTTICIALLSAYASVQVNKHPSSLWFYYLFIPLTVFPFISRLSTNILFDGILYDMVVAVSWIVGYIIFGASASFTTVNYVGAFVVIVGLLLMKL